MSAGKRPVFPQLARESTCVGYLAIAILVLACFTSAQTSLEANTVHRFSGEQDGQYSAGDYRSDSNTIVRQGRELAMAPGSTVRFKKYAGLLVSGRLVCRGTPEAPVVFCPLAEKPGENRWNGIAVADSAEIDFDYVKIVGSVLSLTVAPHARVRLHHTLFDDNLKGDVVLGDSVVTFRNGISGAWLYGVTAPISPLPGEHPIKNQNTNVSPFVMPVQIGFASIALAGGALWYFFDTRVAHYQQAFDAAKDPQEASSAHDTRDRAVTGRTAGAAACIAGAAGTAISITIPLIVRHKHGR